MVGHDLCAASDHEPAALTVYLLRHPTAVCPGWLDRSLGRPRQHLGNVSAADFHLHSADFDFEVIVINLAGDSSCAAHRFELDRIAFRDMLYHSRLSVGIALIGTRAVRD